MGIHFPKKGALEIRIGRCAQVNRDTFWAGGSILESRMVAALEAKGFDVDIRGDQRSMQGETFAFLQEKAVLINE